MYHNQDGNNEKREEKNPNDKTSLKKSPSASQVQNLTDKPPLQKRKKSYSALIINEIKNPASSAPSPLSIKQPVSNKSSAKSAPVSLHSDKGLKPAKTHEAPVAALKEKKPGTHLRIETETSRKNNTTPSSAVKKTKSGKIFSAPSKVHSKKPDKNLSVKRLGPCLTLEKLFEGDQGSMLAYLGMAEKAKLMLQSLEGKVLTLVSSSRFIEDSIYLALRSNLFYIAHAEFLLIFKEKLIDSCLAQAYNEKKDSKIKLVITYMKEAIQNLMEIRLENLATNSKYGVTLIEGEEASSVKLAAELIVRRSVSEYLKLAALPATLQADIKKRYDVNNYPQLLTKLSEEKVKLYNYRQQLETKILDYIEISQLHQSFQNAGQAQQETLENSLTIIKKFVFLKDAPADKSLIKYFIKLKGIDRLLQNLASDAFTENKGALFNAINLLLAKFIYRLISQEGEKALECAKKLPLHQNVEERNAESEATDFIRQSAIQIKEKKIIISELLLLFSDELIQQGLQIRRCFDNKFEEHSTPQIEFKANETLVKYIILFRLLKTKELADQIKLECQKLNPSSPSIYASAQAVPIMGIFKPPSPTTTPHNTTHTISLGSNGQKGGKGDEAATRINIRNPLSNAVQPPSTDKNIDDITSSESEEEKPINIFKKTT